MSLISSPHNERVKLVRLLQRQPKARRQHKLLVLEGVRLVGDALDAGILPQFVFTLPDAAEEGLLAELVARLEARRVLVQAVTPALMNEMADTETPQGVLGVFPWPELPAPEAPGLVLVVDGWRDPGNLGTVLRTAAAAGVDLVVLTPGTVDAFNPKTLRAGMGAQFRVPIRVRSWADLAAEGERLAFYLAEMGGDTDYAAVDWTQPSAIVVGGEAYGLDHLAQHLPHTLIRIPMVGGTESLNAAVAASILIYEAHRQRSAGAG